MEAQAVIKFWFEELESKQHWIKDAALDQQIRERFGEIHKAARLGELWSWRASPIGRLAEVIVLDQFSRNIYRNQGESFGCDAIALVLAQEAVARKVDLDLSIEQRAFLYLPFMHSESLLVHERALSLFNQPGLENSYNFELKHLEILKQFGRYPHRNDILGRQSSDAERAFLQQPGSSF